MLRTGLPYLSLFDLNSSQRRRRNARGSQSI